MLHWFMLLCCLGDEIIRMKDHDKRNTSENRITIIRVNVFFSDPVILFLVSVHTENSGEQAFQILCEYSQCLRGRIALWATEIF